MKTKLIALVIAGGLTPAAAMAQPTIYGTINVDSEFAKRSDATAAGLLNPDLRSALVRDRCTASWPRASRMMGSRAAFDSDQRARQRHD